MTKEIQYLKQAITLALKAKGKTSPNPMVGAVIVKNKKVIAQGWHKRCGADHAEIMALKQAGPKAQGATLYVTLEPCYHFGRTPPCVEAIISSGIKEVVIGMKDLNPLTNGKSIVQLRKSGVHVRVGFLKSELSKLNEVFIKYIKYKMPFVVAKTAQTLDGKIATSRGQSQWITSQQSRDFAHKLRDDFDAILVGINTILKDNPFLNAQNKSKKIKKVVVDARLQISHRAKIFYKTNPSDCIIVTTKKASFKKIDFFKKKRG